MSSIDISETYQMTNVGDHIDGTDVYQSNRNLLDNPWFTVNQRGVNGTITNEQYGVDRWMAGGGTVTMATGGITLGAGNSYALQRAADPSIFNGKTVTLSVMTSDGTIESGTVVAQTGSAKVVRTANFELCIGYTAYNSFYFYNTSSSAKTVVAAKLELGSVSTLANDAPPDYGTELLKCQYYFRRMRVYDGSLFAIGVSTNTTNAYFPAIIPSPMRVARPTATFSGTMYVKEHTGSGDHVVTAITARADGNRTGLLCTISSISAADVVCSLRMAANTYIDLSADL